MFFKSANLLIFLKIFLDFFQKNSRYFKIFPKNKCNFASLKKKIYFKFVELFLKL